MFGVLQANQKMIADLEVLLDEKSIFVSAFEENKLARKILVFDSARLENVKWRDLTNGLD